MKSQMHTFWNSEFFIDYFHLLPPPLFLFFLCVHFYLCSISGGYNSFIREFPFEYNHGFMGCIQHLIIDTEEMKIRDLAKPHRGKILPCAVPYEF